MDKREFWGRWLYAGLVALAVIVFTVLQVRSVQLSNEIKKQENAVTKMAKKVSELEAEEEELSKAVEEKRREEFVSAFGIDISVYDEDRELIEVFLNKAFTWTSGDQYDLQREEIISSKISGAGEFTDTYMMENYRVPVPDHLKGKVKDNDIDVNGLKSQLLTVNSSVAKWEKGKLVYTTRASYQLYINDGDLTGENQTINEMIFQFELSGQKQERQIQSMSSDIAI